MNEFEKIDQFLPLRDVVFQTLRQGILTGELKPGQRLLEIQLADKLGVSRTPIREAIRKLELEGLVTMLPRKGAQVSKISEKSLKDVLEVRRALEALSVKLCCERITSEELEKLETACIGFEKATLSKDAQTIAKADIVFHDIILESTRNDKLMQLVSNLSQQVYRFRFEYVKDASHHPRIMEEHRNILKLITERRSSEAADVMVKHIDNQEASITENLKI